jgi:arylsulfatase A-like enzyme
LLIVLDDFGYNDLGANGNPNTPTPNLDALAAEGILYTRHYADASCSAARAALMTGMNPAVHGLRPNHLGLSVGTPTIASTLRERGYRTQHIGKWHIASATLEQSPSQLGFDDWFGFLHNNELRGPSPDGISYKFPTYENPWLRDNQSPPKQHTGHLTDILTDRAIQFLDQQQGQPEPWFLNLWYFAPHAPIQPGPEFRARYPDTKEGHYRALIDQLDYNIGRVMEALNKSGAADNTLVIVLSDNGGTNQATDNNYPFSGKKTEFLEGGLRTPLFMRWPGHIEPGVVSDEIVSIYDIFPTIAQASAATPPAGLVGRNLLDPERAPTPQLYWENVTGVNHIYSILSADGRWRYTDFVGMTALMDLHANPSGSDNVLDRNPEVAAKLIDDYLQWRKTVRNVTVNYESANTQGGAVLRGDDLQRSPGYSGFTFAIGVTPSAEISSTPEVIAEQAGRWRLEANGTQGMRLEVLGQVITAPALPAGRCSEVVVTTQFNFSPVQPQYNQSFIDIFINGMRANSITKKNPPLNTSGYANPTFIGMNPGGQELFQGTLSQPLIINERVVTDKEGQAIGNGISGVPATCPKNQPG